MKLLPLLWTAALWLGAPACHTEVSRSPVDSPGGAPAVSVATRAWEVVEQGQVTGVVVEFLEREGARRFFSVRNPEQQELGLVDAHGRAWRFLPHEEESEWLGTGTVVEGVRRILGLDGTVELYEIALEMLLDETALPAGAGE